MLVENLFDAKNVVDYHWYLLLSEPDAYLIRFLVNMSTASQVVSALFFYNFFFRVGSVSFFN